MTKRELFEARVHAMACAYVAADLHRDIGDDSITRMAIATVRAVDETLAEIPHVEEPTPAPLAWRPMAEIGEATGRIVVAYMENGHSIPHLTTAGYIRASEDLGWIQLNLPPLPTVKL